MERNSFDGVMALLELTPAGLFCPAADGYIDPWLPVDRAVITHAHGDHARAGSTHYVCSAVVAGILRARIGVRFSGMTNRMNELFDCYGELGFGRFNAYLVPSDVTPRKIGGTPAGTLLFTFKNEKTSQACERIPFHEFCSGRLLLSSLRAPRSS